MPKLRRQSESKQILVVGASRGIGAAVAKHFAQLKYNLAQRFSSDRQAYTLEKTEYVESVMQKARQLLAS